ncbi:MAG: hybrid sensor histidine kinase/response regulator, partial [Gammaproteobacteria bacterium]|nr:hybrid sensor histidine kinase/response regulator [Gammaproteobacteria bacterium]
HYGLAVGEIPRNRVFFSHAILQDEIFEIPGATVAPRFSDNPLVTGEPHVIFCADILLRAPNGA